MIVVLDRRREPTTTWFADSWEEAAAVSPTEDGQTSGITLWSLEEIEEMLEDGTELAPEALRIARAHGQVAEVQSGHDSYSYFAPADAPPLSEVVREWLLREHNCIALEGREAVEEYMREYATPAEAKALKEALEQLP